MKKKTKIVDDIDEDELSMESHPSKSTKRLKKSSSHGLFGFSESNYDFAAPFLLGIPLVTPVWLIQSFALKGCNIGIAVSNFLYIIGISKTFLDQVHRGFFLVASK